MEINMANVAQHKIFPGKPSATSVQGKENEIQQQSRPIPDEFTHQESWKAVLIEDNSPVIFPPVQPLFHGMPIREAFLSVFTPVV